MPIPMSTREPDTALLIFPITQAGSAYPSTVGRPVHLVLEGWDGRLTGVQITDPTRVYWLDATGDVAYQRATGDLVAALSPYRVYIQIQNADGSWASAPTDDYFLLVVAPGGY